MSTATKTVPFLDLKEQHAALRDELQSALMSVLDSCQFALGPAVQQFEKNFAAFAGAEHAVAVNSGTSALHLALRAAGIGPGDEVIVPAYTFVAPITTIVYCGAKPVMVDIDPRSFTVDPKAVEAAITPQTKAILPVHLYGQMADMTAIMALAEEHGLKVIEDSAQAHGASQHGRPAGTVGDFGCFSFYPTKNLGAAGEGGAVTCAGAEAAKLVSVLRSWGSEVRYEHNHIAYNYRMEGFQGAVLDVKLRHLKAYNEGRRRVAEGYNRLLADCPGIQLPDVPESNVPVWHVYALRVEERDRVMAALKERGVASAIYYPIPNHLQPCFANLGYQPGDLPVSEETSKQQLSLPIYPEMPDEDVAYVAEQLRAVVL